MDKPHTLVVYAFDAGKLNFQVSEPEAAEAISKLEEPDEVLRFRSLDKHGRYLGETVIPVRAVTRLDFRMGAVRKETG